MGRKRKARRDLPQRMYFHHGAYFLVDTEGKWHNLGRAYTPALLKYGTLTQEGGKLSTMAAVMDEYMDKFASKKAPNTYRNNLKEIRSLRAVFGGMRPQDVTPQHVYQYMDVRNAPVAANREKSLLSAIFNYAVRKGIVASNPCRQVTRLTERPRKDHEPVISAITSTRPCGTSHRR